MGYNFTVGIQKGTEYEPIGDFLTGYRHGLAGVVFRALNATELDGGASGTGESRLYQRPEIETALQELRPHAGPRCDIDLFRDCVACLERALAALPPDGQVVIRFW